MEGTPAFPDDYKDEYYFTYNSDNIITRDSIRSFYMGTIFKVNRSTYIAKSATRYLIEGAVYDPLTNSPDSKDTTYANAIFNNKNLVSGSDSFFLNITGELLRLNRYQYTYDSKKNPTARMRLPYPVNTSLFDDDGILLPANTLSANNILSVNSYYWGAGTGVQTENITYNYEYNSNGYPAVIRYPGLAGDKRKDILFYRTL